MPFIHGYRNDIFVSYAHVDDQVVPGAEQGWVASLVARLRIELGQELGRSESFSLWTDVQLAGNEPLTPEILENLRGSAVLLLVLSPGYVASAWCLREKNAFLEAVAAWPNARSRIFIVERSELDPSLRPAEFSDLSGYRFWDRDERATARPLSAVRPRFKEEAYDAQVRRLAIELARTLQALERGANAAEPRAAKMDDPAGVFAPSTRIEALPADLRDPEASAALFVGIGQFDRRSYLSQLRFAPDDAIALAHVFVVELSLIAPARSRLALAGEPTSSRARKQLRQLGSAHVSIIPATRSELLYALEDIAHLTPGAMGLCVVTFATHGFEEDGTAYLMPADGSRRFAKETGLPVARVIASLEGAPATRKVCIVDTCRASFDGATRGDQTMSEGFQSALAAADSTALLASCTVGQLSWEAPELEQGIFTHFLVEAVRGEATAASDDGIIRLHNVIDYTLQRTTDWVRRTIKTEQLPWYGGDDAVRSLPVAVCVEARQRSELLKQRSQALADRKEAALGHLLAARGRASNRSLIPASVQVEVERQLDLVAEGELDELLDMLERLADGKAMSCRLFMLWWNARQVHTLAAATSRPRRDQPWENTLGMKFKPVAGVLFGLWPTRLQDFRAFVAATNYDADIGLFSLVDGQWVQRGDTWRSPGFSHGPLHPVAGLAWEDADSFCCWLTEKERRESLLGPSDHYRLPTDAEWSEAVGPTTFPWGEDWPPPAGSGRYAPLIADGQGDAIGDPPGAELFMGTSDVGSFRPNFQGLFDLGGNVWEWCDGWYAKDMNPKELRQQLPFLDDDGGGNSYRFMRGGSWFNGERLKLLSAYRNTGKVPHVRFSNVGFRCVLTLERGGLDFKP